MSPREGLLFVRFCHWAGQGACAHVHPGAFGLSAARVHTRAAGCEDMYAASDALGGPMSATRPESRPEAGRHTGLLRATSMGRLGRREHGCPVLASKPLAGGGALADWALLASALGVPCSLRRGPPPSSPASQAEPVCLAPEPDALSPFFSLGSSSSRQTCPSPIVVLHPGHRKSEGPHGQSPLASLDCLRPGTF